MKLARILPMALITAALAGGAFTYEDANHDTTLRAQSAYVDMPNGVLNNFKLRGGVTAASRTRKLTISANSVDGNLETKAKQTIIRHALATGSVHVVKVGQTGSSTITSSKADYTDRDTDALVVLTGGVRIISESGRGKSVVISGPDGRAILDPPGVKRSANGLRTATMEGGVRVEVSQSNGGHLVATGRQLALDNLSKPATVTLTGGVQVKGTSNSGFGTFQGASKAVLKLNDKGEVIGTQVSS